MTFAKKPRRRFEPTAARFALPPLLASPMLRLMVFALAGVAGAVYGLVRYYTRPMAPLVVTVVPPPSPTYDADAGEWPVPDLWLSDGGAR